MQAQRQRGGGRVVDALAEKLAVALAELRELARGIHPAILTDRGLGPAIEALAPARAGAGRGELAIARAPPPAIEAAAYFVVAEALTNVAKYAQARTCVSTVRRAGRRGHRRGRATTASAARDIETGTGLRGLEDRLSALDGTLELDTPEGGGTRLSARIPCGADGRPEATPDAAAAGDVEEVSAMRRAVLLVARCSLLALARGGLRQGHRGPRARRLRAARASSPRRPPTGARRTARAASASRSSRTAQAASAFWAIVKNGIDAAARQMSVSVSYRSPDTFNVAAHARPHLRGGRLASPTGSSSRSPTRAVAPAIRRAVRAGIPVVSINSGANLWRGLGVLAHVGQREEPAGLRRRQAAWPPPASSARCASSRSCATTRSTSAAPGSRAGCARAARPRATSSSTSPTATSPRPSSRAELAARQADGVLTLTSDAAKTALEAKKQGGRADAGQARHLRPLARDPRGGQGRAHARSRSTSRPTCRATCRS